MKEIELLYSYENISKMLEYDYKLHTWMYDAKFYLVGDEWRVGLKGPACSLESEVHHLRNITDVQLSIIKQREKENENWVAYQNCRKRTCICKQCDKVCDCGQCVEKKSKCVLKS